MPRADLDVASIMLFYSVLESDMLGARRAVGLGADVETADTKAGLTVLMLAARKGHVEMANFLLDSNAYIAATSPRFQCTALHEAVVCGKLKSFLVVKLLLKRGASVSSRTSIGETPLALFARNGHTDAILEFVRAGSDVNAADDNGVTVLMKAAGHGHTDATLELVRAGSDVNAADNEDVTVLMKTAGKDGGASVVQALLEAGADPTRRSGTGSSSCHFAVFSGDPLVVRALLRAGGPIGTAAHALAAEQLSIRNANGMRPLHLVVMKTFLPSLFEMLRVLDRLEDDVVAGVGPWAQLVEGEEGWRCPTEKVLSVQDEEGRTALHLAAGVCCMPAVCALLHRGAIESQRDNNGYTPQHCATRFTFSVNGVLRRRETVEQKKAIAHCLARGPAFVARSLMWPVTTAAPAGSTAARRPPVWRAARYTRRQSKSTKRAFVAAILRDAKKN